MDSLPTTDTLYTNLVNDHQPKDSCGIMSLTGEVTSEPGIVLTQLDSEHRQRKLRQPIETDLNDFKQNGSTPEAVLNGDATHWSMKNNPLPGAPESIWNSLFDFPSIPASPRNDPMPGGNEWKNFGQGNSWPRPIANGLKLPPAQRPPGLDDPFDRHPRPDCGSCNESGQGRAIVHCEICQDNLCPPCYHAHCRVKVTKDHQIRWLVKDPGLYGSSGSSSASVIGGPKSGSGSTGSANSLPQTPDIMEAKIGLPASLGEVVMTSANRSMQSEVLQVYQGAVEKAKVECKTLVNKTVVGMTQIDEAQAHIADMRKRIEMRCANVNAEIKAIAKNYILEITKRQDFLLQRTENIRSRKAAVLEKQAKQLAEAHETLKMMNAQLVLSASSGRETELINTTNQANESLKEIQKVCGNLLVHEDDLLDFTYPNPDVIKTLNSFAFVAGSGFALNSLAEGDGLKKAILGKDARFIVVVKDQLNEQRTSGGDPLRINVIGPDGRIVRHNIFDGQNGTYRVVWKPNVVGEHFINVTLKDLHVQQSPFRVNVRMGRNYTQVDKPLACFGTEGESEGQLCRPWGVCCTKNGLILVANRSNNRIEVFDKEGRFQYKFGTGGKGQGEFERPASVACDSMNRVIVTDKDNHRIQIFTLKGDYLQMFGEKGSKPGQFNYPWDVATNSRDHILVSDTRNHRIQLFTPHGEFLHKYGFEGRDWKHFDSPRGVCFMPDDQIVVTDFNNHRLLVVNQELTCAQYLGKEGSDEGMFTRPNGVAVDEEGNIIVADSRNDRIQVFTSSGRFISKFGVKGTGPGEFDRPSGICISPEGAIIVVDFGNNRVQIF